MVTTEAVQVDKGIMANLRIFISSKNQGRTYGLLGPAMKEAIEDYIKKHSTENV